MLDAINFWLTKKDVPYQSLMKNNIKNMVLETMEGLYKTGTIDGLPTFNSMSKTQIDLKHQLRDLFKSMDFVSNHFLSSRKQKISKHKLQIYSNIYQQLGLAWEYLGSRCRHGDGYRKIKEGKMACKICGKIKG